MAAQKSTAARIIKTKLDNGEQAAFIINLTEIHAVKSSKKKQHSKWQYFNKYKYNQNLRTEL